MSFGGTVRALADNGIALYKPMPDAESGFSAGERVSSRNDLSGLIRGLAEYAAQFGSPNKTSSDDVVLDLETNGFRCILLRLPDTRSKSNLSPRETEIVKLIAKGYPNKIIADILQISSWTVATHLRRIFAKLNTTSRAAVVARLKEEHLI